MLACVKHEAKLSNVGEVTAILYKAIKKCCSYKTTFQLSSPGSEGLSLVDTWKNSVRGRRKNKCKGPEVGVCLSCLRNTWHQSNGWSNSNK